MEVKSEMGQVGFVTQKLSEFDISEEADEKSFQNISSASVETEKNEEIDKTEAADSMIASTGYVPEVAEELEKEENFIYSVKGNEQATDMSSIQSNNENGYKISTNWIPFEHVPCRKNILSMFQAECKKDQESKMENQADSKKNQESTIKMQAESKKRQEVAMKIQENIKKSEETMEFQAETKRGQGVVKKLTFSECETLPNIDTDCDSSKRLFRYDPPMNISLDKSDSKNEMDLSLISSECEKFQEIRPNEIATKNKNQESSKKERWHKPSLNLCLEESDVGKKIDLKLATLPYGNGQDIGLNSILCENDSYETKDIYHRNELPSSLSMRLGTCEVIPGTGSNSTSLESRNEGGKVMYLLPSEQEHNAYENLAGKENGFSTPEPDNAHNVAMIGTPSEDKYANETAKISSECGEQGRRGISSTSLMSEGEIVSGDSSFDCDEDHRENADFVCNECKHSQEFCSEYSNFASKNKQETSKDPPAYGAIANCADLISVVFEHGQKTDKNVNTIESELGQDFGNILKYDKCENEKESVKNYVEYQVKQATGKISVSREGKDQATSKNLIPDESENGHKPVKDLMHGKYLKDNKTTVTIQDTISKGTLGCTEYGVAKSDKVSMTSLTFKEDYFEVPSDSLAEKIVRQAEFYLSDFNILKNNFLLKHIRRNREGYISLKLVSSFRKIKSLTKDCRVVAYSLEGSKLLELNAEKNKVRRIEKIPNLRDTSFGKTVVVFNLPFKNPMAHDLKDLFSKFGSIVSAEIMTPKSPNYNTYHKRCRFHNHEISSTLFGTVEFEKYEDALAAVKDEESYLPKENEMNVVPLVAQKYRSDWTYSNSSSGTFVPAARKGRFRPKSDMQNGRQADDAKTGENEPTKHPLVEAKFYRGSYRPRYPWKPHSQVDVRGKLSTAKSTGDEVGKGSLLKRQLKASNTLNVPFQHQQRGPGRTLPRPGFQGQKFTV